jgi:putative glutamine amidotransferase
VPHNQPGSRDERTHPVAVVPGSRLAEVLATTRCEVNSFHHQAIRELAPGLTISAHAPDGEIEGVEGDPAEPWLLAVQWHPEEFHEHHGAPDHGLFHSLVKEAGKYQRSAVRADR